MTEMINKPNDSRLDRATNATPVTLRALVKFMDAHGIPHDTRFREKTLPDARLQKLFDGTYGLDPLLRHTNPQLPKTGASTIVVFEHRHLNGSLHGEVTATIAQRVGESLRKEVETVYVNAPMNQRIVNGPDGPDNHSIQVMLKNQGIPVMVNSVGWEDPNLSFKRGMQQRKELGKMTAFVVDSTGNEGAGNVWDLGAPPMQKHNAASHFPPLVVHVGAAAMHCGRDGGWRGEWAIEGYSSANGPTFVAPVASSTALKWHQERLPENISGTSASAPYVGGVLAALNAAYGPYLTREQILYSLMATATPVDRVTPFIGKTPRAVALPYKTTASKLRFNPSYGGFGLIHPHKADRLLAQMVNETQADPTRITTPIETTAIYESKAGETPQRDDAGRYIYRVAMPPGCALKTSIEAEFATGFGEVTITSPAGTNFPMVMSQLYVPETRYDKDKRPYPYFVPSKDDRFSMSTSHGWAGENLEGEWVIQSTEPIVRLEMHQHHFMERDIVKEMDVKELLDKPTPDLRHAVEIRNMGNRRIPALVTLGVPIPKLDATSITHARIQAAKELPANTHGGIA